MNRKEPQSYPKDIKPMKPSPFPPRKGEGALQAKEVVMMWKSTKMVICPHCHRMFEMDIEISREGASKKAVKGRGSKGAKK